MAQVSKATWDAFIKVNDLYDAGKLKDQKFTTTDVVKGTLALKQWYMKPLLSLPDEAKLCLLNKVKNRFFSGNLVYLVCLLFGQLIPIISYLSQCKISSKCTVMYFTSNHMRPLSIAILLDHTCAFTCSFAGICGIPYPQTSSPIPWKCLLLLSIVHLSASRDLLYCCRNHHFFDRTWQVTEPLLMYWLIFIHVLINI